jgi:hypothetical protein
MGQMRNPYSIFAENLKRKDHEEELDVDGRMIFEWIL